MLLQEGVQQTRLLLKRISIHWLDLVLSPVSAELRKAWRKVQRLRCCDAPDYRAAVKRMNGYDLQKKKSTRESSGSVGS